jgi:hypothetical protein
MNKKYRNIEDILKNFRKSKMLNIGKFFENIIWLENDIEILFKIKPEYSNDWQMYFDALPTVDIAFGDVTIDQNKRENFFKILKQMGFVPVDQNITGKLKLIDFANKIFISLEDDIYNDREENEEEDDEDGCPVRYSRSYLNLEFYPIQKNKEIVEKLIILIMESISERENNKNNFFMISQNQQGLYNQKTSFKAIPIKDERYDLYYGKSFPHDKFVKFMEDDDTNSLLLFHGDPGGGKSNYLKNLIQKANRDVIYVPPSMVTVISQPSFISYMLSNRKSILLIEDAEAILGKDRNDGTNNLLNLCDGFLKDAMQLKVIATFNADIGEVDPALLRKGRLYHSHEFKKLTKDEANELAKFCEIDHIFEEDVTLADIFNIGDETSDLVKEERPIGFGNF